MTNVVKISKLSAVLTEHRNNLKNLRDHAQSQEGKMIHTGELRELNNIDSLLRELTEIIDGEPQPISELVQVPRDTEELVAILFTKWELPANLRDYNYQSFCDRLAQRFPTKSDHILFIYHLYRNRDLIDAVLLFAGENHSSKREKVIEEPPTKPKETETESLICRYCQKKFSYQKALENHVQKKHSDQVSEILQSQIEIEEEISEFPVESESLQTFLCEYCQKSFKYPKALENHKGKVHAQEISEENLGEGENKEFICPYCGKSFKYQKSFAKHKESCKWRKKGEENGRGYGKGVS